jgi:poly(3-hydroxybutyrate) depolymerase
MLAQVFSRYAWFHGTQELLRLTSKPAEAIASVLTEMANATTACGNLMAPFDWASRATAATLKQWSFLTGEFGDPGFNLNHTVIDGNKVSVEEEVVIKKPFCDIVHFKRDCAGRNDPKLLIFAPMAGHYASLLKGTIKSFLPDHDVYITGWKNAAHVSVDEGEAFGLDDYFAYAKDFITKLGPNVHALAVCQATIPVATAVSRIAEDSPENQPASLTLIAGPGDVRRANCPVTDFAEKNSL